MEQQVKYSDTEINAYILKAVREMGFEYMTPIQEQAIPVLLEGKDVIGQAQTGTGKTAAFSIPMIQKIDISCKKPQGIILCPTRELAMQAAEEIRKITKYMHGLKVLPEDRISANRSGHSVREYRLLSVHRDVSWIICADIRLRLRMFR